MKTLTLTIHLTNEPGAETAVIDGLHDALYDLANAGAIYDEADNGWYYITEGN